MNETDDLTPAERRAFEALPRERAPRGGLEDRVVAALQRRGLLAILRAKEGPRERPFVLATQRHRRWKPWLLGTFPTSGA